MIVEDRHRVQNAMTPGDARGLADRRLILDNMHQ